MTATSKCHQCGATSYKPVLKRDENGAMQPTGEHQCVGCNLVFADINVWRLGSSAKAESKNDGSGA